MLCGFETIFVQVDYFFTCKMLSVLSLFCSAQYMAMKQSMVQNWLLEKTVKNLLHGRLKHERKKTIAQPIQSEGQTLTRSFTPYEIYIYCLLFHIPSSSHIVCFCWIIYLIYADFHFSFLRIAIVVPVSYLQFTHIVIIVMHMRDRIDFDCLLAHFLLLFFSLNFFRFVLVLVLFNRLGWLFTNSGMRLHPFAKYDARQLWWVWMCATCIIFRLLCWFCFWFCFVFCIPGLRFGEHERSIIKLSIVFDFCIFFFNSSSEICFMSILSREKMKRHAIYLNIILTLQNVYICSSCELHHEMVQHHSSWTKLREFIDFRWIFFCFKILTGWSIDAKLDKYAPRYIYHKT